MNNHHIWNTSSMYVHTCWHDNMCYKLLCVILFCLHVMCFICMFYVFCACNVSVYICTFIWNPVKTLLSLLIMISIANGPFQRLPCTGEPHDTGVSRHITYVNAHNIVTYKNTCKQTLHLTMHIKTLHINNITYEQSLHMKHIEYVCSHVLAW